MRPPGGKGISTIKATRGAAASWLFCKLATIKVWTPTASLSSRPTRAGPKLKHNRQKTSLPIATAIHGVQRCRRSATPRLKAAGYQTFRKMGQNRKELCSTKNQVRVIVEVVLGYPGLLAIPPQAALRGPWKLPAVL